jgi:hypothetical protein
MGYAPETPTTAAVDLRGRGNVDGLAWNVVASLMNIRPGRSLGVNYGRTEAGWLLSPQYRRGEELFEVRFLWRKSGRLTIEARARVRRDLHQTRIALQKADEFDGFVRFTWQFRLREPPEVS